MEVLRAVEARDSSGACCKLYLLFMTAGSPVGYSTLSAVVGTPYSSAVPNDQETDASLAREVRVSKSSTGSLFGSDVF